MFHPPEKNRSRGLTLAKRMAANKIESKQKPETRGSGGSRGFFGFLGLFVVGTVGSTDDYSICRDILFQNWCDIL